MSELYERADDERNLKKEVSLCMMYIRFDEFILGKRD